MKSYIQDLYLESFKEIFNENIGSESEDKVAALLRTVDVLASESTKKKIRDFVLPRLDQVIDSLKVMQEVIESEDDIEILKKGRLVSQKLKYAVIAILNKFGDYPEVKKRKDGIVRYTFEHAEALSYATQKSDRIKFEVSSSLSAILQKVDNLGDYRDPYAALMKKRNRKVGMSRAWQIFIFIIVILLFIGRIVLRLMR